MYGFHTGLAVSLDHFTFYSLCMLLEKVAIRCKPCTTDEYSDLNYYFEMDSVLVFAWWTVVVVELMQINSYGEAEIHLYIYLLVQKLWCLSCFLH